MPFQQIQWYIEFLALDSVSEWVLYEVAFFFNLMAQNSMYHLIRLNLMK